MCYKKILEVHSPTRCLEISTTKEIALHHCAGIENWANRNRMPSEAAGFLFTASCCGICALCKCLGLKMSSGQPVE